MTQSWLALLDHTLKQDYPKVRFPVELRAVLDDVTESTRNHRTAEVVREMAISAVTVLVPARLKVHYCHHSSDVTSLPAAIETWQSQEMAIEATTSLNARMNLAASKQKKESDPTIRMIQASAWLLRYGFAHNHKRGAGPLPTRMNEATLRYLITVHVCSFTDYVVTERAVGDLVKTLNDME